MTSNELQKNFKKDFKQTSNRLQNDFTTSSSAACHTETARYVAHSRARDAQPSFRHRDVALERRKIPAILVAVVVLLD